MTVPDLKPRPRALPVPTSSVHIRACPPLGPHSGGRWHLEHPCFQGLCGFPSAVAQLSIRATRESQQTGRGQTPLPSGGPTLPSPPPLPQPPARTPSCPESLLFPLGLSSWAPSHPTACREVMSDSRPWLQP